MFFFEAIQRYLTHSKCRFFQKRTRHLISISHGRLPKLPKIQAKDPESIDVHSELEAERLVVIDESNENNAFRKRKGNPKFFFPYFKSILMINN